MCCGNIVINFSISMGGGTQRGCGKEEDYDLGLKNQNDYAQERLGAKAFGVGG